ncbi:DNA (cytosine-5-)-methyltransferase [Colwellia demingiae]|uniref:DNA (cytosine-5-)-methyltransferase n=1 Tax=Colwellia demingiae TaxID=89401 RepID=A0A5C6Q7G8_9GAMM|nr:DNA (cytosine-5-)-methyltransferase [Colwellia demingiae]TWX64876.1 DNA (cytosine-5-)-methyltransferase [Colwellia demingiae]
MSKNRKVISLFSGAGGMDIGFKDAGFEISVAVEQDPSCCNTLRLNNPDLVVIEGDVNNVSTDHILESAKLKPLEAALVIGGPPCQSFSLAGKRMGMDDDRGKLLLEFSRVVREALPVAFVMENVKGMLNWEKGKAIEAVLNEFKEPVIFRGKEYRYDVTYKVLNSAAYGVPQKRERLFIIGNRVGKAFNFPEATHTSLADTGTDLFASSLQPFATAWDAFGDLPPADEPSETAKRVSQSIKGRIEKHGY